MTDEPDLRATPAAIHKEPDLPTLGDQVASLDIASLIPGRSARLNGVNREHVRLLADSEQPFPPIIVQRVTLTVIAGLHRLEAAILRGDSRIDALFYDGDEDDAFVLTVRTNLGHGLPLSLADRRAAVASIIASHPQWSDRWIASVVGLAPRTVGGLRVSSGADPTQSRIGQDGRVRPLSSADGRKLAEELLTRNPQASLREVAREAGIAPSTVKSVRERVQAGLDPVPGSQQQAPLKQALAAPTTTARRMLSPGQRLASDPAARAAALQSLRKDPSLRFNEVGRALLQWLDAAPVGPEKQLKVLNGVPEYRLDALAALALEAAQAWEELGKQLQQRSRLGATRASSS